MGVGNRKGGGNHGNKNSGHYFEKTNLQILEQSRALLASILATNSAGKDFELTLVKDSVDAMFLESRVWDNDLNAWGAVNYYAPGSTTPVTPTGATTYLDAGDATEATLLALSGTVDKGQWSRIPGNSLEFEWYAGVEAPAGNFENASGNVKNLKTLTYLTSAVPVFYQDFAWDNLDRSIKITARV